DLFETSDALVARFELAGCCARGLQLRVIGRNLHLRGFRQEYSHKHKKAYRQMEIHYDPFERTLALPCAVQGESVRAEYKDGMLEVSLPKATKVVERIQVIEIEI
ncbi:MAG: Hsp20/alpha crystallin family protein, partial [Planctomycetota bacterium]